MNNRVLGLFHVHWDGNSKRNWFSYFHFQKDLYSSLPARKLRKLRTGWTRRGWEDSCFRPSAACVEVGVPFQYPQTLLLGWKRLPEKNKTHVGRQRNTNKILEFFVCSEVRIFWNWFIYYCIFFINNAISVFFLFPIPHV